MSKQLWVVLGFTFLTWGSQSAESLVKKIADPALNTCVKSALLKQGFFELKQIKKLKCHNKGIANIEGIHLLVNLENLSLFNNEITQADLTSLAHLETLNLANNDLQSLNLSGLSKLKTLYLFKNKLTKLDMSGLAALEKLRMMQNQLTSLDITPLSSLKEAHLFDNQLEDLQITGLNNLDFLDVKQNPMPDELYDFYDEQTGIVISHDGNADDWQ